MKTNAASFAMLVTSVALAATCLVAWAIYAAFFWQENQSNSPVSNTPRHAEVPTEEELPIFTSAIQSVISSPGWAAATKLYQSPPTSGQKIFFHKNRIDLPPIRVSNQQSLLEKTSHLTHYTNPKVELHRHQLIQEENQALVALQFYRMVNLPSGRPHMYSIGCILILDQDSAQWSVRERFISIFDGDVRHDMHHWRLGDPSPRVVRSYPATIMKVHDKFDQKLRAEVQQQLQQ